MRTTIVLSLVVALAGCATPTSNVVTNATLMQRLNQSAEEYLRLALAVGEHDADFVDAYFGPPEIREEVRAAKPSLEEIDGRARALLTRLGEVSSDRADHMLQLRHTYLQKQLGAMIARVSMLRGTRLTFDEEAKAIYDVVPPRHTAADFEPVLAELDAMLPGSGTVTERLEAYRRQFIIPKEKLDTVFQTAIAGCRERTVRHITLPPEESFVVEYVTDKSWSGYNWYQGNYRSLIQVNTDLPIFIDRAIDLACHEGYPGHHVYNVLLEKNLVRDRGWLEFTVYPLFSSQSLIAEGTANFGVDVAFPKQERIDYERRVLFPLAGLDPSQAESYYRIQDLTAKLSYAGNEAARRYLNGDFTADQAVDWLVRYALSSPERARQRVRFFDQYRSYVINYNLGKDLVREHIEALGGTADAPERRWRLFEELISSPRLPSDLQRKR